MVWTLVSGAIATVVAIIGLRPLGRTLKNRPSWAYRGALALVVLVAIILIGASMAVTQQGTAAYDALWGIGLGVGFGGLAGLRYGHDGLFSVAPAPSSREGADHS